MAQIDLSRYTAGSTACWRRPQRSCVSLPHRTRTYCTVSLDSAQLGFPIVSSTPVNSPACRVAGATTSTVSTVVVMATPSVDGISLLIVQFKSVGDFGSGRWCVSVSVRVCVCICVCMFPRLFVRECFSSRQMSARVATSITIQTCRSTDARTKCASHQKDPTRIFFKFGMFLFSTMSFRTKPRTPF